MNANKKIIYSSCYLPSDIPKLNEKLKSRLCCGLISKIDTPDYKTRLRILKQNG
jgi:chromosomal replication initiator protein